MSAVDVNDAKSAKRLYMVHQNTKLTQTLPVAGLILSHSRCCFIIAQFRILNFWAIWKASPFILLGQHDSSFNIYFPHVVFIECDCLSAGFSFVLVHMTQILFCLYKPLLLLFALTVVIAAGGFRQWMKYIWVWAKNWGGDGEWLLIQRCDLLYARLIIVSLPQFSCVCLR